MMTTRTGSLTVATWLIGLGIVFLVQRAADLPWSQAWPMFLIVVGVASFVTTILNGRHDIAGIWAFTWPVAWIVVGSILLASTTGTIGSGTRPQPKWSWPLAREIRRPASRRKRKPARRSRRGFTTSPRCNAKRTAGSDSPRSELCKSRRLFTRSTKC